MGCRFQRGSALALPELLLEQGDDGLRPCGACLTRRRARFGQGGARLGGSHLTVGRLYLPGRAAQEGREVLVHNPGEGALGLEHGAHGGLMRGKHTLLLVQAAGL